MNGYVRMGIFENSVAGFVAGWGFRSGAHGWDAVWFVFFVVVFASTGAAHIERGVKETIRVHDLELLNKVRTK